MTKLKQIVGAFQQNHRTAFLAIWDIFFVALALAVIVRKIVSPGLDGGDILFIGLIAAGCTHRCLKMHQKLSRKSLTSSI